jgi:hypothetical protein
MGTLVVMRGNLRRRLEKMEASDFPELHAELSMQLDLIEGELQARADKHAKVGI